MSEAAGNKSDGSSCLLAGVNYDCWRFTEINVEIQDSIFQDIFSVISFYSLYTCDLNENDPLGFLDLNTWHPVGGSVHGGHGNGVLEPCWRKYVIGEAL